MALEAAEPRSVERVVSVVPAGTEILFAMGAGKKLVGVGTYDRWPPEVAALPRVGALLDPNLELMIQLKPQLAIIDAGQRDLARQLEAAGIASYPVHHGSVEDTLKTMEEIGAAIGMKADGVDLASRVRKQLDELRARYRSEHPPRVLLVFGRSPGSFQNLWVVGGKGFMHEILVIAGGANVFADADRLSFKAGLETVMTRSPEVILEFHEGGGTTKIDATKLAEEWRALPGFEKVHVGILIDTTLGIPGPRMPESVRAVAAELERARAGGRRP